MPGWGGRSRPPGWTATTRRILKRDERICYLCGGEATEVDHVINAAAGGSHDDANLRAICSACHRAKTMAEAHAARPRVARAPERHPGLR